jgi:hypothetical protein
MTTRTFVTKSGDTYEWDETPEVKKALKEYHAQFSGNYPGPLYAPNPHIKDGKETN